MLSKQDAIDAAKDRNHMIDESRMIYFKPVDYSDNPIAPEQTAYRLYYWDIFGVSSLSPTSWHWASPTLKPSSKLNVITAISHVPI
ncbi:hypothetical protein 2017MatK_0115 [Vibrio phage ICP1]|nr:hypothetical protein 2017MatK_0115 [Vibrio phage ICP1]